MINVSIVSGTYNRINSLKRMVESVRKSTPYIDYEIVLVDGGSADGTLKWCKSQDDITLIEHGKLLGAVKAFNDGARWAAGDYVILANDDIEFLDNSIYISWLAMQDNPNLGMGCFYQNRGGKDWHIERMPIIRNGKQSSGWYGQVCIVPRWLGNHCGWWGDYLHTYGGDNHLSSMIYETGYQVLPVEGTRISDHEMDDNLRKINNINGANDPKAVNGHHPDSHAWYRKWRNNVNPDLVGAVIPDKIILESPLTKTERILYLPIYEQGWTVQKEQKYGLKEALEKVGLVVEYDYVTRFNALGRKILGEIKAILKDFSPTIVLTQLHDETNISGHAIRQLKVLCPQAYFVNWNGDYWPDNLLTKSGFRLAASFDLMTSVNLDAIEQYQKRGINAQYWQIAWEPAGRINDIGPSTDVIFLGTGYSSERQKLNKFLQSLPHHVSVYGSGWPDGISKGQTMYDFKAGAKLYRGAKIAIGDSQWPESGFVSNRIFQILAAGRVALCHQWFRGIENLGLFDGQNCIIWRDYSDLKAKLNYYLSHEDERVAIANAGEQLALSRHSFDNRVQELMHSINPLTLSVKHLEEYVAWR